MRFETDGVRRLALLQAITDFSKEGVLDESPPGVPRERLLLNSDVRIVTYLPQSLTLEVEAKDPAVVGTSITAWRGSKLTIDGAQAKFFSYTLPFSVSGPRAAAIRLSFTTSQGASWRARPSA